jgi:hypothetical protein
MRSGHHAIISWIMKQQEGPSLFVNNVFEKSKVEFEKFSVYNEEEEDVIWNGGLSNLRSAYIFNMEDAPIERSDDLIGRNKKMIFNGNSKNIFSVVILRDPFNLFASRIKKYRKLLDSEHDSGKTIASYIGNVGWADNDSANMWINYADAYLGDRQLDNKTIYILYNKWVLDLEYRKKVSEVVGDRFNDSGINITSKFGDGSSFDDFSYKKSAQEMDVFNRWMEFRNDKEYLNLFRYNKRMAKLSKEIFDICPLDL